MQVRIHNGVTKLTVTKPELAVLRKAQEIAGAIERVADDDALAGKAQSARDGLAGVLDALAAE